MGISGIVQLFLVFYLAISTVGMVGRDDTPVVAESWNERATIVRQQVQGDRNSVRIPEWLPPFAAHAYTAHAKRYSAAMGCYPSEIVAEPIQMVHTCSGKWIDQDLAKYPLLVQALTCEGTHLLLKFLEDCRFVGGDAEFCGSALLLRAVKVVALLSFIFAQLFLVVGLMTELSRSVSTALFFIWIAGTVSPVLFLVWHYQLRKGGVTPAEFVNETVSAKFTELFKVGFAWMGGEDGDIVVLLREGQPTMSLRRRAVLQQIMGDVRTLRTVLLERGLEGGPMYQEDI